MRVGCRYNGNELRVLLKLGARVNFFLGKGEL
jgi:hypothetical protein